MPRKVIRFALIGICKRCKWKFELNKELIAHMESDLDTIPFSARSASGRICCPDCGHLDIDNHYEYQRKYRVRCQTCNQMFDADFSNVTRCPTCAHEHLKALSKLGV